jgi:hypothetical protein
MRSILVEASFDFARPDPRLAWECFKRFIHLPLPGVSTTTISFECMQVDDRDDVLWLSFMRHLEQGEYGLCGCVVAFETENRKLEKSKKTENVPNIFLALPPPVS